MTSRDLREVPQKARTLVLNMTQIIKSFLHAAHMILLARPTLGGIQYSSKISLLSPPHSVFSLAQVHHL